MSGTLGADARVLFFSERGSVSREDFAADVSRARAALAGPSALLNMLGDRAAFSTALAAGLLNGQQIILPASRAPEAVASVIAGDADARILSQAEDLAGPTVSDARAGDLWADLAQAPGQVHVFTSGSTGGRVKHLKDWRNLAGGAAITDTVLRTAGCTPGQTAILGTTPHQHMYGLEATVFAPMAFGYAVHSGSVFYPADLAQAAAEARAAGLRDIALVTSPAHLRYLEPVLAEVPEIRVIISATAPLSRDVADRIEGAGGPAVWEIYGSSETGSLGVRRTAKEELWSPLAGFEIVAWGDGKAARAPHMAGEIALNDAVAIEPDGRFALLGRLGDMINVAGKRSSLGALNAALEGAPGVVDAVVLCDRTDGDDVLTIAAVAAADGTQSPARIRGGLQAHMRLRIDPVLVPRRLVLVRSLPRNATGKMLARSLNDLTVLSQAAE